MSVARTLFACAWARGLLRTKLHACGRRALTVDTKTHLHVHQIKTSIEYTVHNASELTLIQLAVTAQEAGLLSF